MPPTEKPLEVEIIPPQRRLQPAAVERMMMQVVEAEPRSQPTVLQSYVGTPKPEQKPEPEPLCPHGSAFNDCFNCSNFGENYADVITNERGERVFQFGQAAHRFD